MAKRNVFKNTDITVDSLIKRTNEKMQSQGFYLTESQLAQSILEIFSGVGEMMNYYIERAHEENFPETAKHRSSIVAGAKNLAYIIKRPIPARAEFYIKINKDIANSLTSGIFPTTLQIPGFVSLKYNGKSYTIPKTISVDVIEEDYDKLLAGNDIIIAFNDTNNVKLKNIFDEYEQNTVDEITDDVRIDKPDESIRYIFLNQSIETYNVFQGEIVERVFPASTNEQLNLKFQRYYIDDVTFSNYYGEEYDDFNFTKVWVTSSETRDSSSEYQINRRTFFDIDYAGTFGSEEASSVCVIKTYLDDGVQIEFGDGLYAKLGAETDENIIVQYLSTDGASGNNASVIDKRLTIEDKVYFNGVTSYQNFIDIKFATNLQGGADIEDSESIKANAGLLFSSLDRTILRSDYIAYLRSLTSPIDIKYAKAWGEQDEIQDKRENLVAIKELANVILFSCMGSLYDNEEDTDNFIVKQDLNTVVLDNFPTFTNTSDLVQDQLDYLVKKFMNVIKNVDPSNDDFNLSAIFATQSNEVTDLKISDVIKKLNRRSSFTFKHVYMQPIIKRIGMEGKVVLDSLEDLQKMKRDVNNEIYNYLWKNINFNSPMYKSKLIEIIESFEGVKYTNFDFKYKSDFDSNIGLLNTLKSFVNFNVNELPFANNSDKDVFYDPNVKYLIDSHIDDGLKSDRDFFEKIIQEIIEFFENNQDSTLYKNNGDFLDNVLEIIVICYKYFSETVFEDYMLDEYGNLSTYILTGSGSYSIGNVIPMIESDLTFEYQI